MALLFSWLVDGARFPCLVVKTLSGERSTLVWGGFVCRNPLGSPVHLRATDKVRRQFISTVQRAKFVPVTQSV